MLSERACLPVRCFEVENEDETGLAEPLTTLSFNRDVVAPPDVYVALSGLPDEKSPLLDPGLRSLHSLALGYVISLLRS